MMSNMRSRAASKQDHENRICLIIYISIHRNPLEVKAKPMQPWQKPIAFDGNRESRKKQIN